MHATVRSVIEAASGASEDVCILDTEASPEHLSRGTAQYSERMLIVVEPYYKSLETGRRMALLGRDLGIPRVALVGNKLRDEHEAELVREFAARHGIELAGAVPFDEGLPESERAQLAPLDFAPDGPAIAAIAELGRELARDGRA
jgi:CO dehydrogenase maturation factor